MRSALFILIFSLFIISNGKTQIVKDKKATYKYAGTYYIERMNAETFNYSDNDIEFTIIPNFTGWPIIIENKTKHECLLAKKYIRREQIKQRNLICVNKNSRTLLSSLRGNNCSGVHDEREIY